MAWLAENQPDDVANCVIHNDFKMDNLVFDRDDPTRVIGVLDWEMATLGDPLMDLGGDLAFWVQADDDEEFQLFRRVPTHLPGMITRAEFVERYCERMGFTLTAEQWRFYEIFGLFRLAVISQQIYYRYFHKQTTNEVFAVFGPAVHLAAQAHREAAAVRTRRGRDPAGPARPGLLGRRRLRQPLRRGHEQARITGRPSPPAGSRPPGWCAGACAATGRPPRRRVGGRRVDARVDTDDGWNEFDHVQMLEVHGAPEGGDGEMTRQQFDAWFDAATERWTSGSYDEDYDEPFFTFTSRVESALRRTASGLGSGDAAVVFTSGGPISWVAATLLGGGIDMWMRLNPVTINASVAKVVVGARGTTLVSLNDHSHLEPDHVTYR